jgi:cephalosporin-C deacetylase-like acetyl esterase
MRKIFSFLIAVFICFEVQTQNLLPEMWKFQTGDNPSWASPGFDDSSWHSIKLGLSWEKQGFAGYDGFGWYRATFYIPSSFRETAEKYGGFTLILGMIDDVDFTYFNGKLIGSMGELPPDYVTKYNIARIYQVPVKKVLWDQPNTIAIRVFDLLGDGGPYGFPIQMTVRGLSEKLSINPAFISPDCIVKDLSFFELPLSLENKAKSDISGEISVSVVSDFGIEVINQSQHVTVKGKDDLMLNLPMDGLEPGFYKASISFAGELAYKQLMFGFGYEPEKINSPVDSQPDFESYWQEAKRELASVDPQFRLIKIDSLCSSKKDIYLVEMRSLGNVLIRGWYSVPAKPGKYPAIMQVPGHSGNERPEYVDYGEDIIGFGLNIRGHGNSQDDVSPGFPGYMLAGLESKDTYIYRGAYMDCVRGIDFLFSRQEVDTTRVGVEGGSQGGALTFATAALCNTRIKAGVPQVPFLSDFPDYFKVAIWPGNEFTEYVEVEKKMSWDEVYYTLSYIDIKNLAGWVRAPMLMGVGLIDDVCPPHINFAAYNQLTSEKQYIVYPQAGHGLPEEFLEKRMEFLKKHLNVTQ